MNEYAGYDKECDLCGTVQKFGSITADQVELYRCDSCGTRYCKNCRRTIATAMLAKAQEDPSFKAQIRMPPNNICPDCFGDLQEGVW